MNGMDAPAALDTLQHWFGADKDRAAHILIHIRPMGCAHLVVEHDYGSIVRSVKYSDAGTTPETIKRSRARVQAT